HVVLDNYATHKHPKSLPSRMRGCWLGWRAIRAGPSTSLRPRPPGSMPSKTSFPRRRASASAAASSARSPTCRPPSTLISPSTMPAQNPSSGPNPPMLFSQNSNVALYLLSDSVHYVPDQKSRPYIANEPKELYEEDATNSAWSRSFQPKPTQNT